MNVRALAAVAFALITSAVAPAAAQVAPVTDQSFMMVTVVGDLEQNKSLGWL